MVLDMGIFGRRIAAAYKTTPAPARPPVSITSPWSPQDTLLTWAVDDALAAFTKSENLPMTREVALRIPGVKRAHGIICTQLAEIPLFEMDGETPTEEQPRWLYTSDSGVAPYHRMFGVASDLFFNAWACLGFTADMTDCLHIPFGLWEIDAETGTLTADTERVPAEYTAHLVAIPLGFGENGLLVDGIDTVRQARAIEDAYRKRLDNPIPLTTLTLDADRWDGATPKERSELLETWNRQRRESSTAMKPSWISVDTPGQTAVDLFETGRNGVRIDIANHTALPASILDGVRQGGGGGGTEMRYQGVSNGGERSDLWEFGLAKRMLLAVEARLSLDDVCPPGLSIRGNRAHVITVPEPATTPTSED